MSSATTRPIPVRLRADLQVQRSLHLGREQLVVKDPVGLKYFRFDEQEFALLEQLDGRTSLASMRQAFEDRFRPQAISTEAIHRLICRAHADGLVVSDAPGQGEQLRSRDTNRRIQTRRDAWQSVLCVRFRGIDPGRFLEVLTRWTGWIFSPAAVVTSLAFMVLTLILVAVQFSEIQSRLPQVETLLAVEQWGWLALTLAATKILHELGHGVACRRFGGECHEMGIMLLVLTPCLYCDVSDSWTIPSRWRRIAIAAAGMYLELTLAAICTWLWWWTNPGPLNQFCLSVMCICSIGTVTLNANPLMRYDGYYILSDLVQIPNLRQKASEAVRSVLARIVGRETCELDPFLRGRRSWVLVAYAVAAAIYRWFVLASVLWFLFHLFAPLGLKTVGRLLACLAMYGLLMRPVWRLVRSIIAPDGNLPAGWRRALTGGVIATALGLAACLIPLPHYVRCRMTVRMRGASPVTILSPGTLAEVQAAPGSVVKAGQVLLTLRDTEAELVVERLSGDRRRLDARLDGLRRRSLGGDPAAAAEIQSTRESLAAIAEQLETARRELARLSPTAPRDGVVISDPSPGVANQSSTRVSLISDSVLHPGRLGSYLQRGTVVCQIGDPRELEAELVVDQAQADLIRTGAIVRVFPEQTPGRVFRTRIAAISREVMDSGGHAPRLGRLGASTAKTHDGVAGWQAATCRASCPFEDPEAQLRIGSSGRAKVLVGYATVAQRFWRWWQT